MPDPAKLLELAARCEAASGGDREIDAEIWVHLPEQKPHSWKHRGSLLEYAKQVKGAIFVPTYTDSLDAAMTLLPEKAKVVEFHQDGTHDYMWWCWIAHDLEDAQALCRTAALALTAASLRALAAKEGE